MPQNEPMVYQDPMWPKAVQQFVNQYGREPATDMEMQETEAMMNDLKGMTSRPAMEDKVLRNMGEDPTGGVETQYPGAERRQDAVMDQMGYSRADRNYAGPEGDGRPSTEPVDSGEINWEPDFARFLETQADPAKVEELYRRIDEGEEPEKLTYELFPEYDD